MIELKRAAIEDAETITEIKTKAYNKEIQTYLGRDGGPEGYSRVESQVYIIKTFLAYKIIRDTAIIGAFFLIPMSDAVMRFEDFVIAPEFQNKGYGFQTLQLIEREYSHVRKWSLSTPAFSVGNQHLYEKFGYSEISRNENEIEYEKVINVAK